MPSATRRVATVLLSKCSVDIALPSLTAIPHSVTEIFGSNRAD